MGLNEGREGRSEGEKEGRREGLWGETDKAL